MPPDSHPMTMFSAAILSMQNESIFSKQYQDGMQKSDFWEATLEDSLNLTAKLPGIAAYIYNHLTENWEELEIESVDNGFVTFKTMVLGLFQVAEK